MSDLKFVDTHNLVMFLEKPNESAGFEEIDTIKVKTVNEEVQLHALVDRKKVIITKSTIRRDLQLEDAEGTDCLPNATIFEQLTLMGYEKLSQKLTFYKAFFSLQWKFLIHTILQCLSANTTAWNEFSSTMASAIILDEPANVENVPTHSNDLLLSGEDSLKLNDLMEICTKLQQRVLDMENTKTTQVQEISSLKLKVKRSAQVVSSKDESLGDQEDASKQGRKIDDIDKDAKVTLVDETQERYGDDLVFDTSVLNGEEVFAGQDMVEKEVSTDDPVTTVGEVVTTASVEVSVATTKTTNSTTTVADEVEMTLAQTLIEIKSAKPKVVVQEPVQSTTTTASSIISKAKIITFKDPGESTTRTTLIPIPSNIKDKVKAKMIEPEKPLKKKEQIRLDEELAFKLQAEEEEQARLAR
ncbi:hypothetical protein Tco_1374355 [Tanacetum coccineum]